MALEIWKLVIEILKTLFTSWPLALCIIAFIFRKSVAQIAREVSDAIPRALKEGRALDLTANKEGFAVKIAGTLQAEAIAESQKPFQGVSETKAVEPVSAASSGDVEIPPVVENYGIAEFGSVLHQHESIIRRDLDALKLPLDNPKTSNVLIRNLAVTQLSAAAERTYRIIFGSQIYLLQKMNENGGLDRLAVEGVYAAVRDEYPDLYTTYDFNSYVNFLVSQGLAQTATGERFIITDRGKVFLKWMIDNQLSGNKPF